MWWVLIISGIIVGAYYFNKGNTSQQQNTTNSLIKQFPQPTVPSTQSPKLGTYTSSNKVVFTQVGNIFLTDGKTKKLLSSASDPIMDLSVTSDGQKIAYTYAASSNPSKNFGYPKTALAVLDVNDVNNKELISLKDTVVRYPVWSEGNKLLSVWLNDGVSARIYSTSDNSIILDLHSSDQNKGVSPIVFVPSSQNRVSYILDGQLTEQDVKTQEKTVLSVDAVSSRPVHEGPVLPNPPYYSADGNYVAFYNKNGDLIILNKTTKSIKTVAQGYKAEFFDNNYPSGFIVGFDKQNNFIFTVLGKEGYSLGAKTPIYIYSTKDGNISDFPIPDSSTDISSFVLSSNSEEVVSHSSYTGHGLTVYSPNGKVLNDCSKIDFRYSFYHWGGGPNYSSVLKVWSSDGKYILSESGDSLDVFNTETCTASILVNEKFNTAVWIP